MRIGGALSMQKRDRCLKYTMVFLQAIVLFPKQLKLIMNTCPVPQRTRFNYQKMCLLIGSPNVFKVLEIILTSHWYLFSAITFCPTLELVLVFNQNPNLGVFPTSETLKIKR